ncbi:beta-N-acetylhexosaminidase [Antarcticirhabdus aurantiaca]|uniref:Beta-N-acetylhexosaminidase n=1 Tax=Antarcticirhabdus aurantiaca TaxID=2606717 RepID=A0ACD4NWN2_9HYPH|nr:beta-N-acetylhexosaminidase [Antarcticirhabdus aurantiaca]WAJ31130.1 beta-N-acetylhexosaminidase [Jeongeuplla avenae]
MSGSKSWIAAPLGTSVSREERAFFGGEAPWGFILFGRNISEPNQVSDLVAELKDVGGRDSTPVFIDQEGGRVQRLRPPLAPRYPPARTLGDLTERDPSLAERAAWIQGRLHAIDLARYGIKADCIPCVDVPVEGSHSVIGDRAFSTDPELVARYGRAMADGFAAGGGLPVVKHMPGHGRGNADSHLDLPVVSASPAELEDSDFVPFRALRNLPAAMSAHLLFEAIDPKRPATLSPIVIQSVIRESIGFDGLLMTDDVSMKALRGDFYDLSAAALSAGCDVVLHCNGDMAEMRRVAAAARPLAGDSARRAAAAEAFGARTPEVADEAALREEFAELLAQVA